MKIKAEIEERAADVAPNGQRKIKKEAPDSSIPPFGIGTVRKSIDDVAPPAPISIPKRKIKEEPSDSFPPFGMVAVKKEVQSIDDVASPGISKRKIKEEVIDTDDDDQIIVLKKKKVVKEHNFMLVNVQFKEEKTEEKMMKMLIEKADIRNLKFMGVQPLLKISDRCIFRVTAFTDEDAQLIEERIEEMRWHELFCIDNLQDANPFFWKSLEDEQIVTAILLATYQQLNLSTPPMKTLTQLLEDKRVIRQAMGSGIVMRTLRKKGLNKLARKMLESIRKDIPKDTPKMKKQPVPPGDIQIQPSTKIVFNAPFHANRINFINIINTSARRIAYRIHISQSHQTRLGVKHPHRVLDPKESALVAVTCYAAPLRHVADTVINDCINIAWINTPDGAPKRFYSDWFDAPAISRYKDLPIEYNA